MKKLPKKKPAKAKPKPVERSREIPDTSDQLAVLLKDVGDVKFLSTKEEASIVRTIFPGFNRASRVSGIPLNCMTLIHGPSKGGKTAFAMGMVLSFQQAGHLVFYIDAEGTLAKGWFEKCGGRPELLPYDVPDTYEQAVDRVNKLIKNFEKGREKGTIDKSQGLLIVVDSITKLTPEKELEKLGEVGKGYPLSALFNTVWLDKLTPKVTKLPIQFMMIAHEKRVLDSRSPVPVYKAKGGDSLIYDPSMVVRIDSAKKLKRKVKDGSVVIGQEHRGIVTKNKLGILAEQFVFVMSNGKGFCPIGFDLAREVMEEAKLRDGVKCHLTRKTGAVWHFPTFPDGKIKGDENCARFLGKNPDVLVQIVAHLDDTAIDAVVTVDDDD